MLNNQAPEPRVHNKNVLQVHSIFYTIQGEGPFCGKPALFIRLAGCVIQCPGCDTDYTSRRKHYHVTDLIDHCQRTMYKGGLIVITGGEPFRQDLSLFIPELTKRGFVVQVETNGMVPPSQGVHFSTDLHQPQGKAYIVCSPKDKVINEAILRACCCLKYVMGADDVGEDGLPNTVLGRRLKGIVADLLHGFNVRFICNQWMKRTKKRMQGMFRLAFEVAWKRDTPFNCKSTNI